MSSAARQPLMMDWDEKMLRGLRMKQMVNIGLSATAMVVALGAVALLIALLVPYGATVNESHCPVAMGVNQNAQCLVSRRVGAPAMCEQGPAPTDKKCNSKCYVSGTAAHCDGHGHCVADNVSACKGQCSADDSSVYNNDDPLCTTDLFPIKPYWLEPGQLLEEAAFEAITFGSNPVCLAQVCTYNLVQAQAVTINIDPWLASTYAALETSCHDLLDHRSTTVDTSCIVAKETRVDSNFLTPFIADFFGYPFSSVNFVGRICSFSYACARPNSDVFYDPANLDALGNFTVRRASNATRRIVSRGNNLPPRASPSP